MPQDGHESERDLSTSGGGGDEPEPEGLEQAATGEDEISRRRLLAVLGGTAGAGAALAAAPAIAGAQSALAAKKAKVVGQPKHGTNSLELLARIDQEGTAIAVTGYLTRIAGVSDGQLFTRPRGVKFDDPDSTNPATARFTILASATIKSLSATQNVITALGNGTFWLYYQANGGASFGDRASFARGKKIGTYKLSFQDNLITSGPGPGASNDGEATVYLAGKLAQRAASSFRLGGKKTVIGEKGLDLRLEALGSGELLDASNPTARIFIVGSLIAIE